MLKIKLSDIKFVAHLNASMYTRISSKYIVHVPHEPIFFIHRFYLLCYFTIPVHVFAILHITLRKKYIVLIFYNKSFFFGRNTS